jgi:hypothetical protein
MVSHLPGGQAGISLKGLAVAAEQVSKREREREAHKALSNGISSFTHPEAEARHELSQLWMGDSSPTTSSSEKLQRGMDAPGGTELGPFLQ